MMRLYFQPQVIAHLACFIAWAEAEDLKQCSHESGGHS